MYYVVVNPASKSGHGAKIWSTLEPVLKGRNIPYQVFFSKRAGHVMEIVRKLTAPSSDSAAGSLKLIILGGDGTVNEALQGIADFEKVQIGYIPTGSSNDLARDLGLSKDPVANLEKILSCGQTVQMDIGCVTYENISNELSRHHGTELLQKRFFSVSCGIGFDAAVCEEALTSRFKNILNKIGLGKLTYLIIALKQLITAKKISCDIRLDDKDPIHLKRFLFVTGMIHQYEGGGFMFCPKADYHNGMLDICSVGNIPKLLALTALPTAFVGKHYLFKGIERYSAKTLKLTASVPLWVHTDGEVSIKAGAITLTCEKNKLQMLL